MLKQIGILYFFFLLWWIKSLFSLHDYYFAELLFVLLKENFVLIVLFTFIMWVGFLYYVEKLFINR